MLVFDKLDAIRTFVALLFVALWAINCFKIYAITESRTTYFRFVFGLIFFVATLLSLYFIVWHLSVVVSESFEKFVRESRIELGVISERSEDLANLISSPLFIALLYVFAFPRIPWIFSGFRKFVHNISGIPQAYKKLALELRKAEFNFQETNIKNFHKNLKKYGIYSETDYRELESVLFQYYRRSFILLENIKKLQRLKKYRRFFRNSTEEWGDILETFEPISRRCLNTLSIVRMIGRAIHKENRSQFDQFNINVHGKDRESPEYVLLFALGKAEIGILHDLRTFHSRLCKFCAKAVLSSNFTASGRGQMLERIGFVITRPFLSSQVDIPIIVLLAFLSCMVFYNWWLGMTFGRFDDYRLLIIMTSVIHGFAAWCAVYPKFRDTYRVQTVTGDVRRPIGAHFLSGLAAAVMGIVISYVFFEFMMPNWRQSASTSDAFLSRTIWSLMPFTTAFTLSLVIDLHRTNKGKTSFQTQLTDGLIIGTALLTAFLVVYSFGAFREMRPFSIWASVDVIKRAALFFTVGVVVGFFVPKIVRDRTARHKGVYWIPTSKRAGSLVDQIQSPDSALNASRRESKALAPADPTRQM